MGYPKPRPCDKFTWAMMTFVPSFVLPHRTDRNIPNETPGSARLELMNLGRVLDEVSVDFDLEYAFLKSDWLRTVSKEPGSEFHSLGRAAVIRFKDVMTGSVESGEIVNKLRESFLNRLGEFRHGCTMYQLPGSSSMPMRVRVVMGEIELPPGSEATVDAGTWLAEPVPVRVRSWDLDLEPKFIELARHYLFGEPNIDMLMEQFFKEHGRGNIINMLDVIKAEVLEQRVRQGVDFRNMPACADASLDATSHNEVRADTVTGEDVVIDTGEDAPNEAQDDPEKHPDFQAAQTTLGFVGCADGPSQPASVASDGNVTETETNSAAPAEKGGKVVVDAVADSAASLSPAVKRALRKEK